MSQISCIIVRKNRIHLMQTHYKELIRWLDKNFLKLNNRIQKNKTTRTGLAIKSRKINEYLDGGYIIIDCNDRVIINNQCAFSLDALSKDIRKALIRWDYFDFLR